MINWAELTDKELVEKGETQIWLSSFASNNPKAPAHKEVDELWRYTTDNGKKHLYQRAWNRAYKSAGYEPSEIEIEAARDPK
ncbi:MAG: hypothetical protein [Bacteriophage sp.]|nr:MAG: hypothetical protein [Bacteriophage sp.]